MHRLCWKFDNDINCYGAQILKRSKKKWASNGLINIVKIIENSQLSNPLVQGNARRDSDAAFEMLMRQWREGAPQSDPCL